MAIQISDNLQNNSPKSQDNKYLFNGTTPYTSTSEVNSNIVSAYRHIGLTVLLYISGQFVEYWYKTNITNGGLVEKSVVTVDDVTIEKYLGLLRVKDKGISMAKIQDIPSQTVIGRTDAGTGVPSAISIAAISAATDTNFVKDDLIASGNRVHDFITYDLSVQNIGDLALEAENYFLSGTIDVTDIEDDFNLLTLDNITGQLKSTDNITGSSQKNFISEFDAATETDFPLNPGIGGTMKGDWWFVISAGTVRGMALEIGDSIVARVDAPVRTTSTNWIRIIGSKGVAAIRKLGQVMLAHPNDVANAAEGYNINPSPKAVTADTLVARTATETRIGLAEIATQAEVDTGTDDLRFVTPLKLKNRLTSRYYILLDNFNRTNSTSNIGNLLFPNVAWTQAYGTWGIQSNRAYTTGMIGGGSYEQFITVVDSGLTEYTYEVDIALKLVTGFNSEGGLVFRYADIANYNLLYIYPAEIKLFSYTGGVPTQIGSTASIPATANVMNTYKIVIIENIITAYKNGTPIITGTSSANNSATMVGLCDVSGGGFGGGCLFDNLTLK